MSFSLIKQYPDGLDSNVAELWFKIGQSNAGDGGSMTMSSLQSEYTSGHSKEFVWNGTQFEEIDSTTNNNQFPNQSNGFTSEFAFLRSRSALTGRNIYLVNYHVGGTGLEAGISTPDWSPTGTLRGLFLTEWNNAINWLNSNTVSFFKMGGFWIQGERDASDATAAGNYATNIATLYTWLLNNTGVKQIINPRISSTLPAGSYPNTNTVQSAQSGIANGDTIISYSINGPMQGDNIHYNEDGYETMGFFNSNYVKNG